MFTQTLIKLLSPEVFSQELKRRREIRKQTVEEAAEFCGVDSKSWEKWESCSGQKPPLATMVGVLTVLDSVRLCEFEFDVLHGMGVQPTAEDLLGAAKKAREARE